MRALLVPLLLVSSISCKEDSKQQASTVDPKLPIVIYYTLPG